MHVTKIGIIILVVGGALFWVTKLINDASVFSIAMPVLPYSAEPVNVGTVSSSHGRVDQKIWGTATFCPRPPEYSGESKYKEGNRNALCSKNPNARAGNFGYSKKQLRTKMQGALDELRVPRRSQGDTQSVKPWKILDWGSGCGEMLDWMREDYAAVGFGIEYSEFLAKWSINNTNNSICWGNAANLDWLQEQTFDAVIAHGTMYHLVETQDRKSLKKQKVCSAVRSIMRVLKPGASLFVDYNPPENIPSDIWSKCMPASEVYVSAPRNMVQWQRKLDPRMNTYAGKHRYIIVLTKVAPQD